MKISRISVCFLFLFFIFKEVKSQDIDQAGAMIIPSAQTKKENEEKLRRFQVDSCFLSVLKKIVEKDTLCNYYQKDNTGYLMSVMDIKKWGYLVTISPVHLDKIRKGTSSGIFEFGGRKFLFSVSDSAKKIQEEIFHAAGNDSTAIKINTNSPLTFGEMYTGGDVSSLWKIVSCYNHKFFFQVTAYCEAIGITSQKEREKMMKKMRKEINQ